MGRFLRGQDIIAERPRVFSVRSTLEDDGGRRRPNPCLFVKPKRAKSMSHPRGPEPTVEPDGKESFERPPAATAQGPAAQRGLSACAIAASAALLVAMCWPMFAGRLPVFNDLGNFHLPLRDFYARCLVEGDSFDGLLQT